MDSSGEADDRSERLRRVGLLGGIHAVFKAQRTTLGETMFLLVVCYGYWSEMPYLPNSCKLEAKMDTTCMSQGKRKGRKLLIK